MFHRMETAPQCQSTSYSSTGPSLDWSATLPVLSGSSNFIVNSSQTSKSESSPFDGLWNGNIRNWLGTFGRLTFKRLSTTYGNQYCAIHVCAGLTLTNSRFFGRTFWQKVSVTLYVSRTTTTHPLHSLIAVYVSNGFHFLTKTNGSVLHPVAFGSRHTRGNEQYLHLYLGEGFASNWAMNKVRHMCYRCQFVWVTDCYAVKFLLLYNGANQAILRLQMHLMGWDVKIVHRTNDYLVDADYWSRLDSDLCYNPSFKKYPRLVAEMQKNYPAPKELSMKDKHMPYYRGPRIPANHCPPGTSTEANAEDTDVDAVATAMISSIVTRGDAGCTSLCVRPAEFGDFNKLENTLVGRSLYNSDVPGHAYRASHFIWAMYGFNSVHFSSTIIKPNLPFRVVLVCDPYESNHALLHEFVQCPTILPSASALLDHVQALGNQEPIDGYLIHSHRYQNSNPATAFWAIQASIVAQLHVICRLNLFVAFAHPDHDGRSVSKFVKTLTSSS